jgi:APA family basic amino acid/polyamine antiporter
MTDKTPKPRAAGPADEVDPAESGTQDGGQPALARSVTGKLLYVFILGDVLGAGVYALVGVMAGEVGGAVWLPLLVALGLALLTAGSYAELVTKYPKAGGAAVFAERAFKTPWVSFLVGYSMLAAGVTSAAGLAIAFAGDYFTTFVSMPTTLAAVGFLVLVALLNMRGIKESLRANVAMTVIELSGLLLIVVLAAVVLGRGEGDIARTVEFTEGTAPAVAVLGAALLAFYSFVGFETSANLAEEVVDVRRTYPRALFASLITAGVVYVAVGIAAVAVVSPETLASSTGPLLEVVAVADVVPERVFAVIALVAVANGALLTMIMASRLTYGMASQGLLPPVLARVLPGRRTPWVAIVVTTLVAMALVFTGELQVLAETVVLLLLIVFISTNVAVLVLRKDTVAQDHFKVVTVVPVLGVISCLALLTQQSAGTWLRAGILLAVGAVLYLVTRRASRRAPESTEVA